jgi:hypothetical protein
MAKPSRTLPPVRSKTLRRKGNHPANPYPVPEEALSVHEKAQRIQPLDLSDEAQLGRPAPSQQAPAASPQDEEPTFVLRASDKLAPMLVRAWANMTAELGLGRPDALAQARRCALQMDEWRREKNSNRS